MIRRLLAVLALLVVAALGMHAVGEPQGSAAAPPSTAAAKPIRLSIDYRDGVIKTFTAIEHRAGLTVYDALQAAAKHPRGIKLETKGSGETAFVIAIDDLKNEGGGSDTRNWQFRINGERGKRGSGVTELAAGDEVLWSFEVFQTGK